MTVNVVFAFPELTFLFLGFAFNPTIFAHRDRAAEGVSVDDMIKATIDRETVVGRGDASPL